MREIKFRGKIEGNWWYVTPDDDAWEQFWTLVDKSTVGQYIGLEDRYDHDIYEGDIVAYLDNTSQGLVKKIVPITDIRHLPDFGCSKWEEVIGNIYGNGDLLEESQA